MANSERTHRVLMVGLPRSGKTTFLAALWHVLEERGSSTQLRLDRFSGDRAYLNRICESWRSCSPIERTRLEANERVTLHLLDEEDSGLELTIPDLSGEAYGLQLTERRWTKEYDELVSSVDGVLLFVHPDVEKGARIDTASALEEALHEDAQNVEGTIPAAKQEYRADKHGSAATSWSQEQVPTQVQLVELLQFILERRDDGCRVVVAMSAWDLLLGLKQDPAKVIEEQMPLLWQFLKSNSGLLDHTIVGISAQGGDLTDDRNMLLEQASPIDRIKVVGSDTHSDDITSPIAWLLR